jgi:N-acyl-D-amino-acid deacylase
MLTFRKPDILSLTLLLALGSLLTLVVTYRLRQPWPSCSQEFDLIISGAEVFDGSGEEPFVGDIGIKKQRIACVGILKGSSAKRIIDANGLSVAPGFIDVHTHIERNVPTNSPFVAPNFIRQGVTTIITGNCGRSFLDIGKFLQTLEVNRSQVNVASLIGHNTIRQFVMKQASSAPSCDQLMQMSKLADQAMADGALGMSTGLVYVPGTFAKTDEILELVKPVARNNGVYVSHIRDEGTKGVEAIEEAIAIGQKTGAHVHISHFKAQGPKQWGTAQARLDLVKSARSAGQNVSLDQYPYKASSTGLAVLLPSWLSDGSLSTAKRRLNDPVIRSRVRSEMLAKLRDSGWTDYSFARIAYYQFDQSLVGLNIAEVSKRSRGVGPVSQHVNLGDSPSTKGAKKDDNELTRQADTVIDLFTHGGAQMVFFDMAEADIETIIKDSDVMFGSDSSVRGDDSFSIPHPRGSGTFPRVLGVYSRDKALFSTQEAIRRMTSLPAATFGIKERGYIRKDHWADLVIFDRNHILDTATYEEPLNSPNGILYVIVNGSIVLDGQVRTRSYPGTAIRHERAKLNQ